MTSLKDIMSLINGSRRDYLKQLAFQLKEKLKRKPTAIEMREAINDAAKNDFPKLDYQLNEPVKPTTTRTREKGQYD